MSLNKDDINIVVTQGKTHSNVSLFLQEVSVSCKERLYFVVRPNCPVLKAEPNAANTRPSKSSGPWVGGKLLINIGEFGTEKRLHTFF